MFELINARSQAYGQPGIFQTGNKSGGKTLKRDVKGSIGQSDG